MTTMQRRILDRLAKAGRYGIPSNRLAIDVDEGHARDMGMSLNTVHQHIHSLRRCGAVIKSRPGIGGRYVLVSFPDL